MTDALYRLVWNQEVRQQLEAGAARLSRDRASGLLLPVARGGANIVGLPRLEPVLTSGGSVLSRLGPMLGVANLFAGVANLVVGGMNLYQIRQLRREVREEAAQTRELMLRGFVALSQQIDAGFDQIDYRLVNLEHGMDQVGLQTALALVLLTRVEDLTRHGFEATLAGIQELRGETRSGFKRLDHLIRDGLKEVKDTRLREAANTLEQARERIANLSDRDPNADLQRVFDEVSRVVPTLRAHREGRGDLSLPESAAVVLLEVHAHQTEAIARALHDDRRPAMAALKRAHELARTEALRLIDEPASTPFEFHGVRAPTASMLLAAADASRLGMLAFSEEAPEVLEIDEPPPLTEGGHDRLLLPALALHGGDTVGSDRFVTVTGDLASRVGAGSEAGRKYQAPFSNVAKAAGLSVSKPKAGAEPKISDSDLLAILDPASAQAVRIEFGRALLRDADTSLRELAATRLSRSLGVGVSPEDLRSFRQDLVDFLAALERVAGQPSSVEWAPVPTHTEETALEIIRQAEARNTRDAQAIKDLDAKVDQTLAFFRSLLLDSYLVACRCLAAADDSRVVSTKLKHIYTSGDFADAAGNANWQAIGAKLDQLRDWLKQQGLLV